MIFLWNLYRLGHVKNELFYPLEPPYTPPATSFQDKINNILEKESLSQDSSYKEVNNDFAVAIEIINKNKEIKK